MNRARRVDTTIAAAVCLLCLTATGASNAQKAPSYSGTNTHEAGVVEFPGGRVVVGSVGDPDAAAYAEGAALPNPGAKLAGPSFEEWLAAA